MTSTWRTSSPCSTRPARNAPWSSAGRSTRRAILTAALHPDRVAGLCVLGIGQGQPTCSPRPSQRSAPFDEQRDSYERPEVQPPLLGAGHRDFAEFFFGLCIAEPHSTKHLEDLIGWAMDTTPALAATVPAIVEQPMPPEIWTKVSCPMLVIAGADDALTPAAIGIAVAEATDAELIVMEGVGHNPPGRAPVRFNLACVTRRPRAAGAPDLAQSVHRPRRALFVSSPIGLGHAWRDVAIARELRALVPDLEIHWLAQEPVTRVLEAEGERIHPASAELASEATHIDAEVQGHELDVFRAYRRMDEILLANFMLFHDVVEQEPYDLWIGDEAWEIDHFLHQNPECKRAAYVWLTTSSGSSHLPRATSARPSSPLTTTPRCSSRSSAIHALDRSIFIGTPCDIVPDRFGPDLPHIREWTEEHFAFTGDVPGHDGARSSLDRDALRAEFGYADDDRICIAMAGGSAAGESLLRRHRGPRGRCGPRPRPADDHHRRPTYSNRHAASCNRRGDRRLRPRPEPSARGMYVAVVHGGLATTMELTGARRPFLYFPLKHHFEQQRHVRHRLEPYRAWVLHAHRRFTTGRRRRRDRRRA